MTDVTFETFAERVLGAWFKEDREDAQGAAPSVSTPKEAAARAVYEAIVTHAQAKGTVLVRCSDASSARACTDYLRSYFSDQPTLAKLARKQDGDGIHLRSGVRITVTDDVTRRPRNLLLSIFLDNAMVDEPTELKSDQELARDLAHMFLVEANGGTGIEADRLIALECARTIQARLDPPDAADSWDWIQGNFSCRDDSRDELR